MAKPERAREPEDEERLTHGYHQELDADRNGIPDHLEEEHRAAEAERERKSRDLNRNGIPDYLESNAANDDCVPYDRDVHRNSTLDRQTRHAAAVVAATQVTGEPDHTFKDSVQAASAVLSQEIQKDESNPKKGGFGKEALAKRMSKLRNKRIPKSSILGDISRLPNAKVDPDSGFDMVKAAWRGLLTGIRSEQQTLTNKRNAKLDLEMAELRDAQRKLDQAEEKAAIDGGKARETAQEPVLGSKSQQEPANEAKEPEVSSPGNNGGPENEGGGNQGGPDRGSGGGSTPPPAVSPSSELEKVAANDTDFRRSTEPHAQLGDDLSTSKVATEQQVATGPAKSATAEKNGTQVAADPKAPGSREAAGGAAVGNSGMGMAVAATNPIAGVAITAVQAREAQKDAGQEFNGKDARAKTPPQAPTQTSAKTAAAAPADKPGSKPARRERSLGLAPKIPTQPRGNVYALPTRGLSPDKRGPLYDQARNLKSKGLSAPVISKGPANPAPRIRAVGLGSGIAIFTKAVRTVAPRDASVELQRHMQNQRDSGGRGR